MNYTGMWIQAISWENFFSYPEGSIRLASMTLIGGVINGSGKTSIVQAICFALTGKLLLGISPPDAVKHGSTGMKVILEGIYNDQPFVLIRTFKLPSSRSLSFIIETDGKKESIPNPQAEILDNVITYDEFINLIYVDGHHIERLMLGKDESRSKMLDKIFGIETLRKIIDSIKINPYINEYNDLENQKTILQKRKEDDTKLISDISHLEDLQKKMSDLKAQKSTIDGEIAIFSSQVNNAYTIYTQNEKNKKDKVSLEYRVQSSQEQLNELEKRIAILLQKYTQITEDLSKQDIQSPNIEVHISSLLSKIESLKKNIVSNQIAHKKNLAILFLQRYLKIEEECPTCFQKVVIIQQREHIKNIIAPEMLVVEEAIAADTKKISDIEAEIRVWQHKQEIMDQTQAEISEIQKKYDLISGTITKLQSAIEILNINIEQSNNYAEVSQLLSKKQYQSNSLETQIEMLHNHISSVLQKKEEYQKTTIANIEKQINDITDNQVKLQAKRKLAESLRGAFNVLQSHIRHDTLETLNPIIQQLLDFMRPTETNDVHPIRYEIQLEVKKIRQEETYLYHNIVHVYNDRTEYTALSTGQKALCSLALILAISEALHPNLSIVAFDEIHTSGIDNEVSNQLLQAIVKIASKIHIIFIDRNPKLNNAIFNHSVKQKLKCYLYNAENKHGNSLIAQEKSS